MNNTTSKLILATLGGIVLGSAIGLLLAPEAGSKIRRKLAGRAADIDDQIDDLISEGKKSWKNMKAQGENASDDMEAYLDHLVAEGKKSWAKMQAELAEKTEEVQETTEIAANKVVREGKRLWNTLTDKSEEIVDDVKQVIQKTESKLS